MQILFLGYGREETTLLDFIESQGHVVTHIHERVSDLSEADLVISFGYRHILDQDTLATAKRPPLNLHISFLPFNRGAHPNFWSWIDGTPAGVTIHEIDPGLDTGDIIVQERLEGASPEMSLAQTHRMLTSQIEDLFRRYSTSLFDGTYPRSAQSGPSTSHRARDLPAWVEWDMPISEAIEKNTRKQSIVIVLANLMDVDGNLNAESRGRVETACAVFQDIDADLMLFMGWDYRPDTDLPISVAMRDYQQKLLDIPPDTVLVDRQSRDTVGDAVYSRRLVDQIGTIDNVTVVSSDYHVPRALEIFTFVYGPDFTVSARGSKPGGPLTAESEFESTAAFRRTFDGIGPGDIEAITARMTTAHPFYNGERYSHVQL